MRARIGLVLLVMACGRDKDGGGDGPAARVGEGLLAEGCPGGGEAAARRIGVDASIPGEAAVAGKGDYLLLNDRAAFAITAPGDQLTYYYYPGVVADAAPLSGCAFAGQDKLDELGLLVGQLEITDWQQSVLRAFRAETVEVIADGSDGGAAIVRATGTDDTHWLIEYTLVREAADDGGRPPSEALGLRLTVDYVLEPDSPVLEIVLGVENTGSAPLSLVNANLMSTAPTLSLFGHASTSISVGGFGIDYGYPWLVATDGEGALAYGVEDGNLGALTISGVTALIDVTQALGEPIAVGPGGVDSRTFYLSVGATDGPSATAPLSEANPAPLPGLSMSFEPLGGVVRGPDGPVAGATVALQASSDGAGWSALDRATTDAEGRFTLYAPVSTADWAWRVVASAEGRDDSEALELSPGEEGLALELGAAGALAYAISDAEGQPSPGRLHLVRASDGATLDLWLAGEGTAPVPPGDWSWTLTRGYEYRPQSGDLSVPEGGTGALEATLERVVDTSGWMSVDTHVHTSDSPDSDVTQADQLLHAAAHGLEIVVHTEHEHIVDRRAVPAESDLDPWVNNVIGQEVTASMPEHLTMFPVEPDGSGRGGFIEWYGLDLDEIFGAMRERSGGGVNLLNHPGYLGDIGWDRLSASPSLDDPTLMGLEADAALWSWDLDGVEVMNGHGSPFTDGNGRFDDWASMINAGHRLVAVGCSDDHGGDEVGFPRSYFRSGTDDPASLDLDELVGGFQGGALMASAGAFAAVDIDGAGPGELVQASGGELTLNLRIEAIPEIDVTHAVVLLNCDEVLALPASDPAGVVKLEEQVELSLEADGWISVVAFGEERLPLGMPQYDPSRTPRVLTSPIYVDVDGDGAFGAPGGRQCRYSLRAP